MWVEAMELCIKFSSMESWTFLKKILHYFTEGIKIAYLYNVGLLYSFSLFNDFVYLIY